MARYPYKDLGNKFDVYFRNDLNQNFDDVETDFKEVKTKTDSLAATTNENTDQLNQIEAGSQDNEVISARGQYASLKDRLDAIDTGFVIQEELFVATEGQTVFTLQNGSYEVGQNRLWIESIDNVPQDDSIFSETSTTSFTLNESLTAGQEVFVRYVNGTLPMRTGHNKVHELGGYDEIDVTKLKNYQEEIVAPLADNENQIGILQKNSTSILSHGADSTFLDNTQVIQNAVNSLALTGGTVVIPYGNFKCNSDNWGTRNYGISIPANVTLLGVGGSSIQVTGTQNKHLFAVNGSNVKAFGIKFTGNRTKPTTEQTIQDEFGRCFDVAGSSTNHIKSLQVKYCEFTDFRTEAVRLADYTYHCTVSNNYYHHMVDALCSMGSLTGRNCSGHFVENNFCEEWYSDSAIKCRYYVDDVVIKGNVLKSTLAQNDANANRTGRDGMWIRGGHRILVEGNILYNIGLRGIRCDMSNPDGKTGETTQDLTIKGNIIHSDGSCVVGRGNRYIVEGNQLKSNGDIAVNLGDSTEAVVYTGLSVKNNIISLGYLGGIYFYRIEKSDVEGNDVQATTSGHGIYGQSLNNILYSKNRVQSAAGTSKHGYSYLNANKLRFTDNEALNCANTGFNMGTSSYKVSDSIFTGNIAIGNNVGAVLNGNSDIVKNNIIKGNTSSQLTTTGLDVASIVADNITSQ